MDVLVTEWLQVTQSPRHWVPLPRVPSCADVLAKFAMTKASTPGAVAWAELAAGLRAYFDATLPKLLLYRQEREQYDKFARGCNPAPSRLLSRTGHMSRRSRRAINSLWRRAPSPAPIPATASTRAY